MRNEKYTYTRRGVFLFTGTNLISDITVKDYVLILLEEYGDLNRGDMNKISGIPRTTIFESLIKLELEGKIKRYYAERKERGRPITMWGLKD